MARRKSLRNGVQYGVFLPVGGEALETQVPWVFDDHNGTATFC